MTVDERIKKIDNKIDEYKSSIRVQKETRDSLSRSLQGEIQLGRGGIEQAFEAIRGFVKPYDDAIDSYYKKVAKLEEEKKELTIPGYKDEKQRKEQEKQHKEQERKLQEWEKCANQKFQEIKSNYEREKENEKQEREKSWKEEINRMERRAEQGLCMYCGQKTRFLYLFKIRCKNQSCMIAEGTGKYAKMKGFGPHGFSSNSSIKNVASREDFRKRESEKSSWDRIFESGLNKKRDEIADKYKTWLENELEQANKESSKLLGSGKQECEKRIILIKKELGLPVEDSLIVNTVEFDAKDKKDKEHNANHPAKESIMDNLVFVDGQKDNHWIYYSSKSDGNKLYKINVDGSGKEQLNDERSGSVKVVDEWIYYSNGDKNHYNLYKVHINGSGRQRLSSDTSSYIITIVDDWIYYCGSYPFGRNNLFRVRKDGNDKQQLNNDVSSYISVVDEWIYYCNESDESKLYKIRTDGSNKQKLNDDRSSYISVLDEWIYYNNTHDYSGKFYKIRTDGSSRQKIDDDVSHHINVIGEWIYYCSNTDGDNPNPDGGYKIRIDGSNKQKLFDGSTLSLKVVNDWVYYYILSFGGKKHPAYKIRIDGTEHQSVSLDILS